MIGRHRLGVIDQHHVTHGESRRLALLHRQRQRAGAGLSGQLVVERVVDRVAARIHRRLAVEQDVAPPRHVDVLGGAGQAIWLAALADRLALLVDDARQDGEVRLPGGLVVVDEVGDAAARHLHVERDARGAVGLGELEGRRP